MKHAFHPEAKRELDEAATCYGAVDEHLRHFVLKRFPFSVVYAATDELVYIMAVAHGSREPGYWRARVRDR